MTDQNREEDSPLERNLDSDELKFRNATVAGGLTAFLSSASCQLNWNDPEYVAQPIVELALKEYGLPIMAGILVGGVAYLVTGLVEKYRNQSEDRK